MFGNEKHKRADIGQFSGKTTIIAQEAELRGDVRFTGALQVDGRIIGDIETDQGLVRVSEHGYVEGIIRAPSVLVNGQVVGDVHASEHLELDTKARIAGDLYYQAMEMVIGAQISGQLHYVGGSEAMSLRTIGADAEPEQ
ncbi:polymer-forming cytoskeletal protein [Halopseudomonas nanhaiensis]|uniref:bactofilin family protein n=1 Tax=Halopseudomonas nanhaiensis TaxID=2830842 RepID=UPI001CBB48ED|nr:polymer-forming cytoskeletal protein [Halopseudomonas nanhaiensis]UAW98074.1 polymer-forming cytoskeletal protein [Halopseudomonas nanhaiensis]